MPFQKNKQAKGFFSAAEDSDDESLVEVAILTENKKPRLFKDGLLYIKYSTMI